MTFTGFALSGSAAGNYELTAQPDQMTADITRKELTIDGLKVKDKQYDGRNTAEIDGTPTLVGVVDGDVLKLVNGVPAFATVTPGKNIPVRFTAFTLSGDDETLGNYSLKQPESITASILEYSADGSEYGVNSNDWINTDFVITAKEGYELSLTNTAEGQWTDTLAASEETDHGTLTFYVRNMATGAISGAMTESYKIDKTPPTGAVVLTERTALQTALYRLSFHLFFRSNVNVKLTAADEASGVKSVGYYQSDKELSQEEIQAIANWTEGRNFEIQAKDMDRFVIYVRVEDQAGNVGYANSEGAVFDTTAPKISGIENGGVFYVTRKVTVSDANLDAVTLNGGRAGTEITLKGNVDETYVIRAVDKAGNVTEYTVTMKPISSITAPIGEITTDHVKSSDRTAIETVAEQLAGIDQENADQAELDELWAAMGLCQGLARRIAEVAEEITRLTEAAGGYDMDKVTSNDRAALEKLAADIDTLLATDNLTDRERSQLEALKKALQALLDRIEAARAAAESRDILAVRDVTKDNVKREDKSNLEKAEKALEEALVRFTGNYTEEERKDLEAKLAVIKAALAAIANAERLAGEIKKLPSVDQAALRDKSEVDRVQNLVKDLTENEKAMLGKDALDKVDALAKKIQKLASDAGKTNAPNTGDTGNLSLWIVLLAVSLGTLTGAVALDKKKKHSVK